MIRLAHNRFGYLLCLNLSLIACSGGGDSGGSFAGDVDFDAAPKAQDNVDFLNACETGNFCFAVDTARQSPISPLIYGTNDIAVSGSPRFSFHRFGGNRLTAYNWENNASNAGEDYHNQSDGYLGGGDTPGEATRSRIASAHANGAPALITIPIQGFVAADKNGGGDVDQTPNYLQTRFHQSVASKSSPLNLAPDLTDNFVYQDEFVNYIENLFPGVHNGGAPEIFYALDNEPGLWSTTHPRIHPNPATYQELIDKSLEYSEAIKGVVSNATIFGPVSYGWQGFANLQNATDANGRDFLETYLNAVRLRSETLGIRLVDAVDVHWYSEARGNGTRITLNNVSEAVNNSAPVADARIQAPRSLWDGSYTEDSWIAQYMTTGPIQLIPYLKGIIDRSYPGTKIAFTEYNHGGGTHISGAIAQADTLGIFGREGIYAANYWILKDNNEPFPYAAFDMYRDFDASDRMFGDTSVAADTADIAQSSVYGSLDNDGRMILVVINKSSTDMPTNFQFANGQGYRNAEFFHLTAASAVPQAGAIQNLADRYRLSTTLPAQSVTTIVLSAN